jgi:hypothetical protein
MAATRYWSVEECRWVDPATADRLEEPADQALTDELSSLPRQRGLEELRRRSWEGVEA